MKNNGEQSWIAARIEEVLNDAAYDVHAAEAQLLEVQKENLKLNAEIQVLKESLEALGLAQLKTVEYYQNRISGLEKELEYEKKVARAYKDKALTAGKVLW